MQVPYAKAAAEAVWPVPAATPSGSLSVTSTQDGVHGHGHTHTAGMG